jgi:hypothetical protein
MNQISICDVTLVTVVDADFGAKMRDRYGYKLQLTAVNYFIHELFFIISDTPSVTIYQA